jgi:hypothetical protein
VRLFIFVLPGGHCSPGNSMAYLSWQLGVGVAAIHQKPTPVWHRDSPPRIHAFRKNKNAAVAGLWKKPVRKARKTNSRFSSLPTALGNRARDSHFSHSPDCCWYFYEFNN